MDKFYSHYSHLVMKIHLFTFIPTLLHSNHRKTSKVSNPFPLFKLQLKNKTLTREMLLSAVDSLNGYFKIFSNKCRFG